MSKVSAAVSRSGLALVFAVGLWAANFGGISCGARSELEVGPPVTVPECIVDADCEGFDNKCRNVRCVVPPNDGSATSTGAGVGGANPNVAKTGICEDGIPVDCDDDDVCTVDNCNPETGACEHQPASFDVDGDGVNGPREGKRFDDADSCGRDCDDTNPRAYPAHDGIPAATEVCDGADNDCNKIVDDNATFTPLAAEPVRISSDVPPAEVGGLAWSGESYAAVYTGKSDGTNILRSMLTGFGDKIPPGEQRITAQNADSYSGPVHWVGDRFGVIWQERRFGDYEIYFALLDERGEKFIPDVQLSFASGFSIYPDLAYTGSNFVAVWQDERSGQFEIYGQLLNLDGVPVGGEVQLTDPFLDFPNEAPAVAASSQGIGLVWSNGDTVEHHIRFRTLGFDLNPSERTVELTDGTTAAVYPTVIFNENRYIVAWHDQSASPAGIYAAALDLSGNILVGATPISNPGNRRSRYPYLRALGDRILFVYADDRDGGDYELYSRVVDNNLIPLSQEARITKAQGDSINPIVSFGPEGEVGVLFKDNRSGQQHVWFTRLGCSAGMPPN